MNQDQKRWLQLAHVAVCVARADIACTEEALREVLLGSMPAVKSDKATGAATAEVEPRADPVHAAVAAAALERSRGFFYEWLKRRRRPWGSTDWVYYGAELRRRRLLARCSVAELERRTRLPASIIRRIEQGFGRPRPSKLTLAQLALALGMPMPPRPAGAGKGSTSGKPPK